MATKVSLPENPSGKRYEDAIAAHLHAAGFYVDGSYSLWESKTEVTDVDVVVTRYSDRLPETRIVEAKSGDWGLGDVLKLAGLRMYLGQPDATLVYKKQYGKLEAARTIAGKLQVSVLNLREPYFPDKSLAALSPPRETLDWAIPVWCFSRWIDRAMIWRLKEWRNSDKSMRCFQYLIDHHRLITDEVFITNEPSARAQCLYEAFMRCPHLSAAVGQELSGNGFDPLGARTIPSSRFHEAFYDCKLNAIQVSAYLEHLARLSILKQVCDAALALRASGSRHVTDEIGEEQMPGLPQSFRHTLAELSAEPYFHLYPLFWQWFLWFFGGFIMLDRLEDEYGLLEACTGVPRGHIQQAFGVYDRLFPKGSTWLREPDGLGIRMVDLFPVPFRGLGVHLRYAHYVKSGDSGGLSAATRTTRELLKWLRCSSRLLEEHPDCYP